MRKSTQVVLVLSGALLAGCGRSQPEKAAEAAGGESDGQSYTNGQYVGSHGYYHAHSGFFRPFPYNHYDASRGYYDGNGWRNTPAPETGVTASRPSARAGSTVRGGFGGADSASS